ncbi:MAG: hypothetical protein WCJ55_05460 [Chloroflexales bacterium]
MVTSTGYDGVGEQDEEDAEDDPPRTARGTRTQPQQLKHRKIEPGSFDPRTLWFSRDAADFALPVTLSPARTLCLC